MSLYLAGRADREYIAETLGMARSNVQLHQGISGLEPDPAVPILGYRRIISRPSPTSGMRADRRWPQEREIDPAAMRCAPAFPPADDPTSVLRGHGLKKAAFHRTVYRWYRNARVPRPRWCR